MMHLNKFHVSVRKCVYYLITWFDLYNPVYSVRIYVSRKSKSVQLGEKCALQFKSYFTFYIFFTVTVVTITFSSSLPA